MSNGKFKLSIVQWVALIAIIFVGVSAVVFVKNKVDRLPFCSGQQLTGSAFLQGETGYEVGNLNLRNISAKKCRLPYRANVVIVSNGQTLDVPQATMSTYGTEPSQSNLLKVLNPKERAVVALMWGNWCSSQLNRKSSFKGLLLVSLDASSSPLRANLTAAELPRCDYPKQPSTLGVGAFQSS